MSFGLRFVMALILGALTADMFSLRGREEDKLRIESLKPGRQVCLIEPMLLPAALAMGMAFFLLWGGVQALGRFAANLWLLFFQIGVYYALRGAVAGAGAAVFSGLDCDGRRQQAACGAHAAQGPV